VVWDNDYVPTKSLKKEETPMTTLKQNYQASIDERKATLQGMICSERDKAIADKLEEAETNGQKTTSCNCD
jgi:hypothetical protein